MKYVLCCPNEACELHGVAFTPGKYVMKYSKELKKMVPTIVGKPYECSNCREQMVFAEVESTIPEFSVGVFKRAVRFLRFVYYTKFTPYSQLDFPPFHRKNPSQRRASEKKVYNAPVLCYTTCRVVRRRVVCLTVFPPRGGASPVEHESRHRSGRCSVFSRVRLLVSFSVASAWR